MDPDLAAALDAGNGLLRRREHPHLANKVDVALRRRRLAALLPGIYCRAEEASSLVLRGRAACLADPDAVIVGPAASVLSGTGPALDPPELVTVASLRLRAPRVGYRWERRLVPPGLVRRVGGVRVATRPLLALDEASTRPDAVEEALRTGVSASSLVTALSLTPGRRGNRARRRRVGGAVDGAWSAAEARAHAALRRARIAGWRANVGLWDRRGEVKLGYGDILFGEVGLVVEIDGAQHTTAEARRQDAARDLAMARAGWEVVRIPATLVMRTPGEFVAIVRDLLATRAGRASG